MAGQDATLLSQELVKAEAAGVGAELLEKAAEKLRELQETETPRADDEDEEASEAVFPSACVLMIFQVEHSCAVL